jgi:hypothetical protein
MSSWLRPPVADVVAALALVIALPALWIAPTLFFASWLTAWWFWIGVTMGGLAATWIHALTGGRWGEALRLVTLPLARGLPWLLLLFLPLAAGMARVFPWAGREAAWTHDIDLPGFQLAWDAPAAFWIRVALFAAVWWGISRPGTLARKGRVAVALMLHLVVGTLASIDFVATLVPGWYSTGNGLVNLAGGALGGTALAVAIVARVAADRFPTPPPRPARPRVPPVWRDLGNLMLMWTMLWAYVAFVEFLIIWAEDLPREIAWFLPRLDSDWAWVGMGLAALQFALPLLALLFRANKDDPRRIARLATWLFAGQLVNTAWLILPSIAPHSALGWWLVPSLAIAMGLPLVARVLRSLEPVASPSERAEAVHA